MEKSTKITTNLLDIVQLIDESEVQSEMGEAFASFMLNPTVTWTKFVLTDDRKNANGQRVPKEEFVNLIRSGIHMPVKMAIGEINRGHDDSKPLGTITHLKETTLEDGRIAVVALAALWSEERPADVKFIKQRFAEKKPVDISWEILYTKEAYNSETDSKDLFGTFLRAATIVGSPAYQGRTPFLAVAAASEEPVSDDISDPSKLAEDELNELDELKAKVTELEAKLAEANSQLEAKVTAEAAKDAEIVRLTEENTALGEYKASIEAKAAREAKLESIKTKFSEAEIEKDDKYFEENAESLLKYDDDQLAFMIQELKAFASSTKPASASTKEKKIPNLVGNDDENLADPKTLGKFLRERGKK